MQKFKSVNELVNRLKPSEPVYCIRTSSIRTASSYFQKNFPGRVLYAVKTNPHPKVLKTKLIVELKILMWLQLKKLKQLKKYPQKLTATT